jgi:hypothetical protein
MNIELKEISVRELSNGYKDNQENGVLGYGGKLDIRPPYQREFIYKDKQRDAVVDTIIKKYPLNVMYWAVREDGNLKLLMVNREQFLYVNILRGILLSIIDIFTIFKKTNKNNY